MGYNQRIIQQYPHMTRLSSSGLKPIRPPKALTRGFSTDNKEEDKAKSGFMNFMETVKKTDEEVAAKDAEKAAAEELNIKELKIEFENRGGANIESGIELS